jgi:hypothetical protein
MDKAIYEQMLIALEILGAPSDLLGSVASRGDTIGDEQVLLDLTNWNQLHHSAKNPTHS